MVDLNSTKIQNFILTSCMSAIEVNRSADTTAQAAASARRRQSMVCTEKSTDGVFKMTIFENSAKQWEREKFQECL